MFRNAAEKKKIMPNLFIYTKPSKDFYFFRPQIAAQINKRNSFIYLLPVNRAVRYFKQQMVEMAQDKIIDSPPVFTFDDLLTNIYCSLPGAKRIIDSSHLLLILRSILQEHAAEFSYLVKETSVTGGLVKKIADILSELRRFGYSCNSFAEVDIAEKENNPLKFSDFELLLNHLESCLAEKLIDGPYAEHQAAHHFTEQQFRMLFPGLQDIYISGYGLFTPAMFTFIERAKSFVNIHVKLDYNSQNKDLFRHVQPAAARFQRIGAAFTENENTSGLDCFLFNRKIEGAEKDNSGAQTAIQPLLDRKNEISYIASQIRKLHLKENIPLHKIAVTFPNLERYVPLIRRIFKDYQIPVNLSTGFNLKQSPLVRLFLEALQLIKQRFEFRPAVSFFKSGFIENSNVLDSVLLQSVFVEYRQNRLLPGWHDKVMSKLSREQKADENLTVQLRLLQAGLQKLYDFPDKASVKIFRESYISLLSGAGLLRWFKNENVHLTERQHEKEFRAYNRFMKMFDRVIWIMDHIYGGKEISVNIFSEFLETAVSREVFNLTEWPEYGVQIMPRLEVLAANPQALFLGGLTDGDFPRASAKDVFFNDALRDKLGLTASEELLDQDRFVFYLLMSSSADRIFLTYPKFEEDRALVPSTFLSDIIEAANVSWADELPDDDYLLNPQQYLLNLGVDIQLRNFDQAAGKIKALTAAGFLRKDSLIKLLKRMEVSSARMSTKNFTEYEADLKSISKIAADLLSRFGQTAWSVSRLETYAYCPMEFYFSYILQAAELPEIEEELGHLERGILLHDILHKFYDELSRKAEAARPLAHRERLIEIAKDAFDRLPFTGILWELERNEFFGSGEEKGLLDTFLEYDQQKIIDSSFVPTFFEYAFGADEELVLGKGETKLKLQGRIDRIDVNDAGQAVIFDYKTGTAAAKIGSAEVMEGLHFQLPLYLMALAKSQRDMKPCAGAFYVVKNTENCKRAELLADSKSVSFTPENKKAMLPNKYYLDEDGKPLDFWDAALHSLRKAHEAAKSIQQGIFRHTKYPDEAHCKTYCEFRRICQKNVGKILKAEEG